MEKAEILGYRIDFRPGDPCYYTPRDMETAIQTGNMSSHFWPLYYSPQPDCPDTVEVYFGWCWIEPKYVFRCPVDNFIPMYRGPKMTLIRDQIFTALTETEILDLVPGLEDCLGDPWDAAKNGNPYSSVPLDMIRLVRAVESRYGIE